MPAARAAPRRIGTAALRDATAAHKVMARADTSTDRSFAGCSLCIGAFLDARPANAEPHAAEKPPRRAPRRSICCRNPAWPTRRADASRSTTVHMKITILDDYFDTLRTLPCFGNWQGARRDRLESSTFSTSTRSTMRLKDAEALVLIRDARSRGASLLERRLTACDSSPTQRVPDSIDVDALHAASHHRVIGPPPGHSRIRHHGTDLGLVLAGGAALPQQVEASRHGRPGVRRHAARQDARRLWLTAGSARLVAGYGRPSA